mgnify:CR=1 FL=1
MTRLCLFLDLVDDAALIAEYRTLHEPGRVPGAVIASIQNRGYEAMEIWNVADRLVMVIEKRDMVISTDEGHVDLSDPDVVAWEKRMDDFQRQLPHALEPIKWAVGEKIFDLNEHKN